MVTISPVGLAAAPVANQLSFLATFKEKLCRCICAVSTEQPYATVSYTYGTPILNGTTLFVPITAAITITLPSCGCKAITQVINERFTVAFQGVTALPSSITVSEVGLTQGLAKVICGKSNTYSINSSAVVTITPVAS